MSDNYNIDSQPAKLPRGLKTLSKVSAQYQQANHQVPMLNIPSLHESASRSASSSPRLPRSKHIEPNHVEPIVAYSLNVPVIAAGRKLSLQPLSHQLNQLKPRQQQQQTNLLDPIEKGQQQVGLLGGTSELLKSTTGSVTSLNNLAVNRQHLAPRKSVIGRLERSSFQTQRLSDVGIAFGQQITAKVGLKLPASQERIVEQTRWLYLRYVFVKLRQNALPLRDLNLTKSSRARRAAALGEGPKVSISAPVTASVAPPELSPFDARSLSRKRTALSQNIDTQDLTSLAARLQTLTMDHDEQPAGLINSENLSSNESVISSNNIGSSLSTSSQSSASTSNRKYIMDPTINKQIFSVIINIIRELRDSKPDFYGDTIYESIGIDKFSSLESLLDVQMTICQEMTRSEISWCRIVALFSLFGAMSLDCVRLGTPENVGPILDGFIEFVERDLALWISQQGGWESFLYKHRAGYQLGYVTPTVLTIALPFLAWILLSLFK